MQYDSVSTLWVPDFGTSQAFQLEEQVIQLPGICGNIHHRWLYGNSARWPWSIKSCYRYTSGLTSMIKPCTISNWISVAQVYTCFWFSSPSTKLNSNCMAYICHIFMSLIVVDVKTPTPGSDHKQASPTFSFSLVEARSPLPQVPTEAWHWLFQLCLQEIRMRWEWSWLGVVLTGTDFDWEQDWCLKI